MHEVLWYEWDVDRATGRTGLLLEPFCFCLLGSDAPVLIPTGMWLVVTLKPLCLPSRKFTLIKVHISHGTATTDCSKSLWNWITDKPNYISNLHTVKLVHIFSEVARAWGRGKAYLHPLLWETLNSVAAFCWAWCCWLHPWQSGWQLGHRIAWNSIMLAH